MSILRYDDNHCQKKENVMPPSVRLKKSIPNVPTIIDRILRGERVHGQWLDDFTFSRFDEAYRAVNSLPLKVVEAKYLRGELEALHTDRVDQATGSVALNTGRHWVYMHIQFDTVPVSITIFDSRGAGITKGTKNSIRGACTSVWGRDNYNISYEYLAQQKDGWSCGYWTLKNYLERAHHNNISTQNDINEVFNWFVNEMYRLCGAAKVQKYLSQDNGVDELNSYVCDMDVNQQARFSSGVLAQLLDVGQGSQDPALRNLINLCAAREVALQQLDAYRSNWFVSSDRTVRAKTLYESIQKAQSMQAIVNALMQAWHGMVWKKTTNYTTSVCLNLRQEIRRDFIKNLAVV